MNFNLFYLFELFFLGNFFVLFIFKGIQIVNFALNIIIKVKIL